ncbi:hypothetical protein M430DRAFT_17319 [Amorphotheca resinae ATCC 22711]|uniref:DUF7923 domain-containing protein n=1 Tax=Amorphotheca resinae ATCC 22711 TaxID=857342 RepID=A0A2T3B939_AMORE|nr:hypothetical protein M430DRAFT_17319 [Amorphotheca resinae ATCC 22711]PSS23399.1 hypothetical protein M430DRAFT_17319 [Amorphotheca resinae ATCC 22711]
MTSISNSETDYRSRFKELQSIEDKKDFLIEELLAALDTITGQQNELKSDLDTEREVRRRLQRTLREAQPVQERFALLIIHLDADVFLFEDSWIHEPVEGGEGMVSALQENTHEYLSSLMDDVSGVEVIVKIYGDLFKMWQRYEEEGSSLGSSDLTRFFSHFNRTEPLVDFMDIGPRKESIVKKLSGVLGHYLTDSRCEHVLLAAPYASIDPIVSPHTTTLSPTPNRLTIIPPPSPSSRTRKPYDSLPYPTTNLFDSLFIHPPHPKTRKKHSKSPPPPAAPAPPPATANVPKLRIRGAKAHERREEPSPVRPGPLLRAPSPPPGYAGPAMGMGMGGQKWGPMQVARVPHGRNEYPRGVMEGPGVPVLRWP